MEHETETRRAVPWPTPVKPLTGKARNCVYFGDTPRDQMRAASYAYWRQRGFSASAALCRALRDSAARITRFPTFHPSINPATAAHGESSVRWFEEPESCGLRLVGLAHEVDSSIDHTGWHLDPHGDGETVSGVVYRLPSKDGRARFLAGYADPWNDGPALLSCDVIEAESPDFADWRRVAVSRYGYSARVAASFTWREVQEANNESALRDAARRADGIAERMAEHEREFQEGWRDGIEAREKANAAHLLGRAVVALCRDLRAMWAARRGAPGLPRQIVADAIRAGLRDLRRARRDYLESRDVARIARDECPAPFMGQDCPARDGFREGYSQGV